MATPAEDDLTAEMARTITALQREVRWLRRERAGEATAEQPDGAPRDEWVSAALAPSAAAVASVLAVEEGVVPDREGFDRLPGGTRKVYLARAEDVLAEVAPLCRAMVEALPGGAEVSLALRRYGLSPDAGLAALLARARAEGSERAAREATEAPVHDEVRTLRAAAQAVELVVVAGERMAADHPSPVAVEVATWFTDRLRRALAAPDVTLSDALAAEREQVLLAVADHLGHTGMDALAWFTEVSSRIDAARGGPDQP